MGKIEIRIYLIAGILTFLVFSAGILIGFYLDTNRINFFNTKLEEFQTDFSNLLLEESFFKSFSLNDEKFCQIYINKANAIADESGKLGDYLESFRGTTKFRSSDLEMIKNKYFLMNLQLWLYFRDLREKCNHNVTTILFFYASQQKCDDCVAEGIVLSRIKKQDPEKYMIFALDKDSKLGIVSTLLSYFNITQVPTMIINEKVKLEGFYSEEELKNFI